MHLTIGKFVVAAGAAALLSSQALHAAPPTSALAVDPLVALSMLGTSQSRAAVCGTGAACALSMTATAASPSAASPAVTAGASAAAVQGGPQQRESRGLVWVLVIGGAMVLIAVLLAALAGDEDNNQPISPA